MHVYPSIPNVFRVGGSSCNVNLLDDNQSSINNINNTGGNSIKRHLKNYSDNNEMNGEINNYRNNNNNNSTLINIETNRNENNRNSIDNGHSGNDIKYGFVIGGNCGGGFSNNHTNSTLIKANSNSNNINNINVNNNNNNNNNSSAIIAKISTISSPNCDSSGSDLNSLNSIDEICSTLPQSTGGGGGGGGGNNRRQNNNSGIVGYIGGKRCTSLSTRRKLSDERSGYLLWIITPVAASFSVAIVVAALAGPQWLLTEERLPNANYNGTANFNVKDDGAFITKYTKSSLWILCSTLQGIESYQCIKIDYFPYEEYRHDPLDSTLAIPYTIIKSSPFFLVSGIILILTFLIFMVAMCSHQNSLYYFASGILFVVSGLLMLIGLIVYISIFKAEIGSKLRPKSTLQPPLFTFTYGQSFFLYVFGFVSTEFVGVLNIFLFISLQQQVGNGKTIPCLAFMNIQEKLLLDAHHGNNGQTLKTYENEKSNFACKKHSNASNMALSTDIERRYYFEKPQKCDVHSQNLAKSLNELYTEPAPIFSPFDLPQEFPLTRSVSTTTEIFSNSNVSDLNTKQQSTLERENKKNQTNDSKESLNDICGLSRGILGKRRKSKDELFNEFCQRAGRRPKPKDIYYIEDNYQVEPENVFIVDNYATLTKNRRNSFIEPRKRNCNASFRSFDKIYPKSLFDLDRCELEAWNNYPDPYFNRGKSHGMEFCHSRTLPRCFMKRNFDSYGINGNNHNQPGLRKSVQFHSSANDGLIRSRDMLHKSFEDVSSINFAVPKKTSNNLGVQWPAAIPTSPSSFSTKSNFHYSMDRPQYAPTKPAVINQFNRAYHYDDHPSIYSNGSVFQTFDLDQIERERRKSHASLFEMGMGYDIVNGTAV